MRFWVILRNGHVDGLASLADAKIHANNLYRAGRAPLVVVAPTKAEALVKADRCWSGEITTVQARKA